MIVDAAEARGPASAGLPIIVHNEVEFLAPERLLPMPNEREYDSHNFKTPSLRRAYSCLPSFMIVSA
jgi:hypothetical protein